MKTFFYCRESDSSDNGVINNVILDIVDADKPSRNYVTMEHTELLLHATACMVAWYFQLSDL